MLKIEGKYLNAKSIVGNKKTLLITFSTKAGNLELVVTSEQWMRYFVADNAPKKSSKWELVVQAKAIPELNQTMLGLVNAKPLIDTSEENLGRVIEILEKIYHRMNNLQIGDNDNTNESESLSSKEASNNSLDYEAVGQNYQPSLENKAKVSEEDLPDVPDNQTRQFNLDQKKPAQPNPEDVAVDQGTGDSITSGFFTETNENSNDDADSSDDSQEEQSNNQQGDVNLGDGPLDLSSGL
ncbi:hypothetical protein ACKN8S_07895 [Limosilactobacillus reuteri]|uniref:hypothetical protein n=1 Tax=Limosilactobacillus reuteri TaxID=1598 RepID=UPI0039BFF0BA